MKTKTFKSKKNMSSYFLKSIFTLTLLTGLACSNESSEELNPINTETSIEEIQATNITNNRDQNPIVIVLQNDNSFKYPEVQSTDEENVYIKNYTGSRIQNWRLTKIDGEWFELRNDFTMRNMMPDGNNIIQGISNPNDDDHLWRFVSVQDCKKLSGQCKKLQNKETRKYATVNLTGNGASVVSSDSNNSSKQLWRVIKID